MQVFDDHGGCGHRYGPCGADTLSEVIKASVSTRCRTLVEEMALAFQASLLIRHSAPEVSDAFVASRLSGQGGRAYGTLPSGVNAPAIIDRAFPA